MEMIKNEAVLAMYKLEGAETCLDWLEAHDPNDCKPSRRGYHHAMQAIIRIRASLNKSHGRKGNVEKTDTFLKSAFRFPHVASPRTPRATVGGLDPSPQLKAVHELAEELNISTNLLEEKEEDLRQKVQDKEEIKQINNNLQAKLISKTKELKRTTSREQYVRGKLRKIEQNTQIQPNTSSNSCQDHDDLMSTIEELQKQNKDLLDENHYLRLLIEDNKEKELKVFDEDSKVYSAALKTCVYALLQHNVSASKVAPVIDTILQLLGIKANRLPSRTTVLDMNLQRLVLAQKQLGEVFASKENTTLLTDDTSKFGKKYMGYEAADGDGNLWVLGLREIETKSAQDTLTVLNELLQDIDDRCQLQEKSPSKCILQHIVATMSDRAATEVKFNDILETYRKDILPLVYTNYDKFTAEEKCSVETLCNFFCGLHALVAFAKTAQESLLRAEKGLFEDAPPIYDKSFGKATEPGTCRLVRTACKAFASGGDEKSGCFGWFSRYLKEFLIEHKLHSVPLVPYRGARFNILFDNAASVYFLHREMIRFLTEYGACNRLLKAVLHDLLTEEYIAGLKALGLLSRLVTGPLWCLLENKNINVLDMNFQYLQLGIFFQCAANDTDTFLTGQLLPFGDQTKIHHDAALKTLLLPSDLDGKVITILKVILPAMEILTKSLFKDHLPGGRYDGADSALKTKVKSAPKTSRFAESVFGNLDYLMRAKPNISTLASEAYIMFVNNKTLPWLEAKTYEERAHLLKASSREVHKLRKDFKERQREIEDHQRKRVRENIEKEEQLRKKRLQQLTRYTDDIVLHSLWQTQEQVDNMVRSYNSISKQREALKIQLNFRKHVLSQHPADSQVFNFTKKCVGTEKRVQLSVEEMIDNVKALVSDSVTREQGAGSTEHILTGKRVRHRFSTGSDMQWYIGKVLSQVPGFHKWFNVRYDDDEAIYSYKLEDDYKKGDLEIIV